MSADLLSDALLCAVAAATKKAVREGGYVCLLDDRGRLLYAYYSPSLVVGDTFVITGPSDDEILRIELTER